MREADAPRRAACAGTSPGPARIAAAVLLGALLVLLLVLPAPASALSRRGYEAGGSFAPAGGAALKAPTDIAVDEASGDVYILDSGNNRVERFDSQGTFVKAWGWGVATGAKELQSCTSESECKPGLAGHGKGELRHATSIAVDNSSGPSRGDVYVEAVTPYDEVVEGHEQEYEYAVIDKFSSEGQLLEHTTKAGEEELEAPVALAVGPDGSLWVNYEEILFRLSGAEGKGALALLEEHTPEFGTGPLLAVTSSRGFFIGHLLSGVQVVGELERALDPVRENDEPLVGAFDEEQTTGLAVGEDGHELFLDHGSSVAFYDTATRREVQRLGEGSLSEAGAMALDERGGASHDVQTLYVLEPASGRVALFVPEAPGAPVVESEATAKVSDSAALLVATIDPRGYQTSYSFRFSTGALPPPQASCSASATPACYETPSEPLGGGFADRQAQQPVSGLPPSTSYHYAVLVHSALLSEGAPTIVQGPERTFTTQPAAPAGGLLDGREWELVSPPGKNGGSVYPLTGYGTTVQAAESGQQITYGVSAAIQDSEEGEPEYPPEGNRVDNIDHVQVVSTRGASRWNSTDIDTRHETNEVEEGGVVFEGTEYQLFSTDLSLAELTTFGHTRLEYPPLSPLTTERTPYERTISRACKASPAPTSCFTPLVTASSVSAGVQFGGTVRFEAADESLRHVVLDSGVRLTEEGPAGMAFYMYEWSAASGHLQLVASASNSQGGGDNGVGYGHHGAPRRLQHAVAANGRVVYHVQGHLYLYDPSAGESVQLDVGGTSRPLFRAADADGTRVFFTDESPLTPDSHASAGHPELFVCEAPVAPKPSCTLHDLTSGAGPGDVLGVLGASDGGDVVYYAANAALAAGAKPGACREGVSAVREEPAEPNGHEEAHQLAGTCNLYVQRYDGAADGWQPPALIGRLSAEDQPDWTITDFATARVSRSGDWLVFMSDRSLGSASSYDTHNLTSDRADEEVYAYNGAAGSLSCVSCHPSGARPAGLLDETQSPEGQGPVVDRDGVWRERWLAGSVPSWNEWNGNEAGYYQPRYLSEGGRVFFNSPEALVPQDTNGKEDVYEWEPAGAGSCTTGSESFVALSEGCLALLSSGTSSHEAAFMDASADGGDAYFVTAASLSPSDYDTTFDMYDAAVCGQPGTSACLPAPPGPAAPCLSAGSCRTPGYTPGGASPLASAGLTGAGNAPQSGQLGVVETKPTRRQKLARALKACRRMHNRHKRKRCEKAAHRRYGPSPAKKSARTTHRVRRSAHARAGGR